MTELIVAFRNFTIAPKQRRLISFIRLYYKFIQLFESENVMKQRIAIAGKNIGTMYT
jgi:hypothetical protein